MLGEKNASYPQDLSPPAGRYCFLVQCRGLILRSGAALDHKLKALSILGDIKKEKKVKEG